MLRYAKVAHQISLHNKGVQSCGGAVPNFLFAYTAITKTPKSYCVFARFCKNQKYKVVLRFGDFLDLWAPFWGPWRRLRGLWVAS